MGIRIGDERTAADLHVAQGHVSAADVQAALERAALDIQLHLLRICAVLRTCCIRYPDGPALFGRDGHIAVQRQVAVMSKSAALAARQQDNVALTRVLHRAVLDGETAAFPDREHRLAAAGQRILVQIQHAGTHVARHNQRLHTQIHIPQQRHHSAVIPAIFLGGQRILQCGGIVRRSGAG